MKMMRKERISEAVGSIHETYIAEAAAYSAEEKGVRRPALKRWGIAAACIAVTVALGAVLLPSILFGRVYTVTLESGDTLRFVRSSDAGIVDKAYYPFEVATRKLNESEIGQLFPDLPVTVDYAEFNAEEGSLFEVYGQIGNVKLEVSAYGLMFKCVVYESGREERVELKGVSVTPGYFTANNQKRIIYYATLEMGDVTVLVENAGNVNNAKAVREELAAVIESLVNLNKIDLTQIKM